MRLRRPKSRSHTVAVTFLGLLGIALLLGPFAQAEGATLHLRNGTLAIECHWTAGDAVIVTRGGAAIRVPRDEIVRIEDAPPAEPCPAAAPPPTMTLGAAPASPAVPAIAPPRFPAPPPDMPLSPAEASLSTAQRQTLADIRQLVSGFVREYQPPLPVEVVVMPLASTNLPSLSSIGVSYSLGRMHVDPRLLGGPSPDAIIAKVLALQLASRPTATSLEDYQREQRQQSFDANAKAVEILARVKGWPEPTAVKSMHAWLLGLHMRGITPPSRSQPTACEQILDLLARFPEQQQWTGGPSCGPPPRAPRSTPARS